MNQDGFPEFNLHDPVSRSGMRRLAETVSGLIRADGLGGRGEFSQGAYNVHPDHRFGFWARLTAVVGSHFSWQEVYRSQNGWLARADGLSGTLNAKEYNGRSDINVGATGDVVWMQLSDESIESGSPWVFFHPGNWDTNPSYNNTSVTSFFSAWNFLFSTLSLTGGSLTLSPTTTFTNNGNTETCGWLFWCKEDLSVTVTANNDVEVDSAKKVVYKVLNTAMADAHFTGIVAGGDGHVVVLHNASDTYTLTLKDSDPSSDDANQFWLPGGSDVVVSPYGTAALWYDPGVSRWKLLWVTPRSCSSYTFNEVDVRCAGPSTYEFYEREVTVSLVDGCWTRDNPTWNKVECTVTGTSTASTGGASMAASGTHTPSSLTCDDLDDYDYVCLVVSGFTGDLADLNGSYELTRVAPTWVWQTDLITCPDDAGLTFRWKVTCTQPGGTAVVAIENTRLVSATAPSVSGTPPEATAVLASTTTLDITACTGGPNAEPYSASCTATFSTDPTPCS